MQHGVNKYRIYRWSFYIGLLVTLFLLILGWWHSNYSSLLVPGARSIAIGRLLGLLAAYTILLQVLLISRVPFVEENFDLHEAIDLHRLNGYAILVAVIGHVVFVVLGYASPVHAGLWHQFWQFNTSYRDVFKATIGTIIFFVAVGLSVYVVRKKMSHELWHLTHLAIYAAILLTFLHQLRVGGDFHSQRWFVAYWYTLYFLVIGMLGYYRFIRIFLAYNRHRFKVERVVKEATSIYSVYITGRYISLFSFKPGQYATWRFLEKGLWWETHPFSFSAAPGKRQLRITVKASSKYGEKLANLKPATIALIDGPRGAFTIDRARAKNIILIAGGIGITPYLSKIDELIKAGKSVTLLYAVHDTGQIAFRQELSNLKSKGLKIEVFVSSEGRRITQDVLKEHIKDDTVIYVCGPDNMSKSFVSTLRILGLPQRSIIAERFAF